MVRSRFCSQGMPGSALKNIMMTRYDLDSEILKVGRHGSRYSSGASFLAALSPVVSIIIIREGNRYGHPTDEVLDRLRAIGSRIYRTDHHVTIMISTDEVSYTVTTLREA